MQKHYLTKQSQYKMFYIKTKRESFQDSLFVKIVINCYLLTIIKSDLLLMACCSSVHFTPLGQFTFNLVSP